MEENKIKQKETDREKEHELLLENDVKGIGITTEGVKGGVTFLSSSSVQFVVLKNGCA